MKLLSGVHHFPEIDSSSLSRLGVATGGNETFIGHRGVRTAERVSGEYDTALNFGVRLALKWHCALQNYYSLGTTLRTIYTASLCHALQPILLDGLLDWQSSK